MKTADPPLRPATRFLISLLGLLILFVPTASFAEEKKELDYKFLEDGTVDLGKFKIKIFDPVLRKTLHINFELLGSVNFEEQEKFMEYMNGRYQQLRELVYTSIQTCTPDQLTDPTHHTLNRKITARVNRAFGWKFINSVEPINYQLVQWSEDEGMVPIPLRPMSKKP